MLGNNQGTNFENRAGTIETVITMQSDIPKGSKSQDALLPSYDKKKRRVTGHGYSIQWMTRIASDEIRSIFRYEDERTKFYFDAERWEWVVPAGTKGTSSSFDTETYKIVSLWDQEPRSPRKIKLSEDSKEIARKNILAGMMLMEEGIDKPPKKVVIAGE